MSYSMPVCNADIGKVNKNEVGSTLVPKHSKCQQLLSFETSEKLYMHASPKWYKLEKKKKKEVSLKGASAFGGYKLWALNYNANSGVGVTFGT